MKDVDIKLKFHEEKMEMIAKYKVLEKKYNETLVSLVGIYVYTWSSINQKLFHCFIDLI